jgi:branched-chain amino acid transport system permease protein
VTFGLSIIIQNGLLQTYGPDTRKLSGGAIELASFRIAGLIDIGVYPLLVFLLAVVAIAGLDMFLYRTSIGARIRAVSNDPEAADLIGLTSARDYPIAMGIVGITMRIYPLTTSADSDMVSLNHKAGGGHVRVHLQRVSSRIPR